MKILLTSTGTRGDVQPLMALASELKNSGHECKFCAPPNFTKWIQGYGFENHPIGIDLEYSTRVAVQTKPVPLSAGQLKQAMTSTVQCQFSVLLEAARGSELIIGGGVPQIAIRTVAEILEISCVMVMYCPVAYPSPQHSPPPISVQRWSELAMLPAGDNESLWANEEQYWNDLYRDVLNQERAKFSLVPVENVMRHALEGKSLLAADEMIAPLAPSIMYDMKVIRTGAWMLPDKTDLPDEVERFLSEGEAPIYFGCGSMVVKEDAARIFVETARSLGKRAIIHKGWSDLKPVDNGRDCLFVKAISHEKLFPRMAAIVHHGGAGTTMAAVRSGVREVIVPHVYDQFFLAQRVNQLGIGIAGPGIQTMTVETLTAALCACFTPEIAAQAQAMPTSIELNGAKIAANWLAENYGQ